MLARTRHTLLLVVALCAGAAACSPARAPAIAGSAEPAPGVLVPASAHPSARLVGSWHGELSAGAVRLPLVIRVSADEDGTLTGRMDSPTQGAIGIPIPRIEVAGDSVRMEVPSLRGFYAGVLFPRERVIRGTWTQGAVSGLLELTAGEPPLVRRPQDPIPPFPYAEEEVAFESTAAGARLVGTLALPAGRGPHPAVVLISGSGPQNRDSELFGHRPFAVISDHLARRGIAVLRYDERGVGASTGVFRTATSLDFAADVEAAVAYLRGRPELDRARIGLIGHSEGGLIAPSSPPVCRAWRSSCCSPGRGPPARRSSTGRGSSSRGRRARTRWPSPCSAPTSSASSRLSARARTLPTPRAG